MGPRARKSVPHTFLGGSGPKKKNFFFWPKTGWGVSGTRVRVQARVFFHFWTVFQIFFFFGPDGQKKKKSSSLRKNFGCSEIVALVRAGKLVYQ
jgi:hypothetical protein